MTCFNDTITGEVVFESSGEGILTPPGMWAGQEYQKDNSVMVVLCDRGYEPEDYIRDYQTIVNLKLSTT